MSTDEQGDGGQGAGYDGFYVVEVQRMVGATLGPELAELIRRLRVADPHFRVFGSEEHEYLFGPVLSDVELTRFELERGVELPADYRSFLTTVGDGGAGPCYGLRTLAVAARADLSKPFPLTCGTNGSGDGKPSGREDWDGYSGVLEVGDHGCGISSYLVVNGPTYGMVWYGREDYIPTGLTFGDWYRHWAESALRALENERLVPLLQVGMSKADVLATVGGDWTERKALRRRIWYFESADIPAQLELNHLGIVVKVNPWPFF